MKYFLTLTTVLLSQLIIAQNETSKDTIKTSELKEVVVGSKKKSIEQKRVTI